MRVLLLALFAACTPSAQTITPAHPAHPDAEPGRLVGPPAALRPGVADVTPAPATRDEHAGHAAPASPAESKPPAPAPEEPAEAKPAAKKPAAKKPAAKKPTVKKPAEKKPADKPAPKPAPDSQQGHQGHGT